MRLLKWKKEILASHVKNWGNFLDVGAYDGFMNQEILDLNQNYFWVDHNESATERARAKGIYVVCSSITDSILPFDKNSMDTIYCSHVLEHMTPEHQSFLFRWFNQVLKVWWIAIIFVPTGYHWTFWDDETHAHPLNHVSLSSLALNSGFDVVQCRYSLARKFPDSIQWRLRFPPIPWYFSEVYLVARKVRKIQNVYYQKSY